MLAAKLPKELSPGEEGFADQCKVYGIFPFREYIFYPTKKWRFDFAFVYGFEKWAVEIEGGTKSGKSRHTRHDGFEHDNEKYNEAAILGWKVLRFTTQQVKSGLAIDTVLRALGKPPR